MMTDAELTDTELWTISQLPADADEIANRSEVTKSAIKSRILRIREKHDDSDIIEWSKEAEHYTWNGDPDVKENLSSYHKGTITRKANKWLSKEEDKLIHKLRKWGLPESPPSPNPGNQDAVLAISDVHIGDVVESLDDSVTHNTEIAKILVHHIFDKAHKLIERKKRSGIEFDTLHINLNGDIVTNENIYEGHFEVLDRFLNKQKEIAVDLFEENIINLASHFPRIQVNCQVGNHGEDRASATSRQANADLHVYRELASRIQSRKDALQSALDSAPPDENTNWFEESLEVYQRIDFNFNNAKKMTKIQLRGGEWEGLLTHGQHLYEQITGTAASDDSLKSLALDRETQFDILWCGHYHEARKVRMMGKEIMRTGSPKPPDDWAKVNTGAGTAPGVEHAIATIHGVSDSRPVTWYYEIDGQGADDSEVSRMQTTATAR